jgi:signal transduction histidine kinase
MRLRALDETAARVGEGELGLRAPTDGSDDAFDRLARRFNAMLDRIEDLLGGVRHATDHIAHDLRTPLTRLRNRLEEARLRPDGERDRALDAAIGETDQLLQAFAALLRLARIEAQPAVDDASVLDLAEVVADAVELYTPSALDHRLRLDAATVPARVRGDRDQLFQLVVNLLDNALKYAPPGSTVRVALECHDGDAILAVDDEGPGVPEAERERVFDRFQRLEVHRGSPGIGLGLSLVRAIVLRHGGHVRLLDRRPGLGVRIALPLSDGDGR